MKYYMIVCPRGHAGRMKSTEIKFAVQAANLLAAMDKAKKMPSVKHLKPILRGWEITENEYKDFRKMSAYERMEAKY